MSAIRRGHSAGGVIQLSDVTTRDRRRNPRRSDSGRTCPPVAWWEVGVVATSVAYFGTMACLWLSRPGLFMDETNFVDAALGGHFRHQLFVYQRIAGVPVLIIQYIGTLKAAFFAPIFATWGVSVSTIRIPVIVLSAVTLVLAFLVGREVVGRWSVVLVVVMATCPTFIFMSKVDWGPIVIAMLLTMVLLLAFFRYLAGGGIGWMWAFVVIALAGVFDKQNFLWIIIAVGVGAATLYPRQLRQRVSERPRAAFFAVATFLACLVLFGLVFVLPNLSANGASSLQNPIPKFALAWGLLERTLGYSAVIEFFTGRSIRQPAWMDLQWMFSLAAFAILGLRRLKGPLDEAAAPSARAAAFFVIVLAVMIVEVAATKQATGPWHVIELLPYPTLVLLCSLAAVWRSGTSFRIAIVATAIGGLGLIMSAQAVSTAQYVSLMRNPSQFQSFFSPALYRDAAFLNQNAGGADEVVSGGWGPGAPLFALSCAADRPKYRDDLWQRLAHVTTATAPATMRKLFGDRRILLVSVDNPDDSDLPTDLRSDTGLLVTAYVSAFPDRHPQRILTTRAYDVTYFGPQPFQGGRSDC